MYPVEGEAPWYDFSIIPLRFELLCSIMILISIKVCLQFELLLTLSLFGFRLQCIKPKFGSGQVRHCQNLVIYKIFGLEPCQNARRINKPLFEYDMWLTCFKNNLITDR